MKRKHYYNLPTDLYKYSWSRTVSETSSSGTLARDLLQLLIAIFESELPSGVQQALQRYCEEKFGKGSDETPVDYLKLADSASKGLVLILADSQLLLKLLQVFNLVSAQCGKTRTKEVSIYHKFIVFLYNSCRDPSRIFQPFLHILNSSPSGSRFSGLFISLITWDPCLLGKKDSSLKQAANFIECGGGRVVLKCLMESASNRQGAENGGVLGGRGLSRQLISNLGLKDISLKAISSASSLINFYRASSYSIQCSKGTKRLSIPTNETRSSSYLFMHSFVQDEKCVKLLVSFPCPILLHNFIFLVQTEAAGKTSGIPSRLCIHSSMHSNQESMVPVTPVFKTNGLKIVNVAFHQPVLSQYLAVYFYKSELHSAVAVSKMEILGTVYGSNSTEAIGPGSKTLTQREKDSPRSVFSDRHV